MMGDYSAYFPPDPLARSSHWRVFHIPHGLKRALRKTPFEIRIDTSICQGDAGMQRGAMRPGSARISSGSYWRTSPARVCAFRGSVEGWRTCGRSMHGVSLGSVFLGNRWGTFSITPPMPGSWRLVRVDRADAKKWIQDAGGAVAHASSQDLRRHRNSTGGIFETPG